MKTIDKKALSEISTWIHRNARPLELAQWSFHNEGGEAGEIIKALAYYQNEDGGFANGIEPDCWNTESSPYATLKAVEILRKNRLIEKIGAEHPMIQGILRYFDSGAQSDEKGWFFCIPSNDHFPRAPWWTFSPETNHVQTMGITAAVCGFVLSHGSGFPALYEKAVAHTKNILARVQDTDDFGEMGIGNVFLLLDDIGRNNLLDSFDCSGVKEKLIQAGNAAMERDPEKWQYYTPRPSVFIWSPESPFYKGNEEIVEVLLDYLIDTRVSGGVWNLTWTWFDLTQVYGAEFAVSQNWWKTTVAMEQLEFLKAFGR